MNCHVRTLSCAALLGVTLASLSQFRPAWAADLDLDWWSLPELHEQARQSELAMAALDADGRSVVTRLLEKDRVVQDLRGGRLALVEAAGRFRAINGAAVESRVEQFGRYSGATEEERLCRQVIQWAASAAVAESAGAAEETRRRLEAELARLLAQNNGVIRLPT